MRPLRRADVTPKNALICIICLVTVFVGTKLFNYLYSDPEPLVLTYGTTRQDSRNWKQGEGDGMEQVSRLLMGKQGVDCGRVEVRSDPKGATECALKALSEGKPFRVRYDLMGIDSEVSGGMVRTPSGQLYAISFDSDPMGRPDNLLSRQVVDKIQSSQPIHVWSIRKDG